MSTHEEILDGLLIGDSTKMIMKRVCSPASCSSSLVLPSYRFKRAILVGKRVGGGSTTGALPTSRTVRSGSPVITTGRVAWVQFPKWKGKCIPEKPVSARKLAATLNEPSSGKVVVGEDLMGGRRPRQRWREEQQRRRVDGESPLSSHLSDPFHSPVSESLEMPRTRNRRRECSISHWPKRVDVSVGVLVSTNNAGSMKIETRSKCQDSAESTICLGTRLKDVLNALITSKELLKIISRIRGQETWPSSSIPLTSVLHIELERASSQVNQLIGEERAGQNEVSYVLKQFGEEKETWKNREHEKVEAMIESITEELEVEREHRRQLESLNTKLGGELAGIKASLLQVSKGLESEQRAKDYVELVCEDLAESIGTDKAKLEEMQREYMSIQEEVAKEKVMLRKANALREERAQMKLSEAKHRFEKKNAAVDKLMETFLRRKEEAQGYADDRMEGDPVRSSDSGFCQREENEGYRKIDDGLDHVEEYDKITYLHSKDPNKGDSNKNSNCASKSLVSMNSNDLKADEEHMRQKCNGAKLSGSTSLLRSVSDIIHWGSIANGTQAFGKKLPHRRSCQDGISRIRRIKDLCGHIRSLSSRPTNERSGSDYIKLNSQFNARLKV